MTITADQLHPGDRITGKHYTNALVEDVIFHADPMCVRVRITYPEGGRWLTFNDNTPITMTNA